MDSPLPFEKALPLKILPLISVIKNRYLALSKPLKWIVAAGFLLLIIFAMRSCSGYNGRREAFRIGQDENWPAIDAMNKQRGLAAFNAELLAAISNQENIRIILRPTPNNLLLDRLNRQELDGILSTLDPTPLNQAYYSFSEPFFPIGPVLIISSRARIKGWNEEGIKLVAVQSNSPALLDLEKDETIHVRLYDNILRALADLDDHRIDGAIFPAIPAYIYTTTFYEGKLKIATPPLNHQGIRLVALKNEKGGKLIASFNQGLQEMRRNGTYKELLVKWGFINFDQQNFE
ncbi:MAG: transporter substrate-binding domain-containing protein [Parachlamydia sp.]|nr:transporter substrate-binding domain-containing protein [Parachlamydia sp.]